jgi:quinol monooxygenase YgiN
MYGLVVRFELAQDAGDKFDALVEETVAKIRAKEPGTLIYATHAVEGEPDVRIFYELYRDREAFEEHERQEHTRRFLLERKHYLAGPTRVDFVTPTDKGSVLGRA